MYAAELETCVNPRAILIIAVGLIVVGMMGCVGAFLFSQALPFVGEAGMNGREGTVDAMFIEEMVPHHQDAIDMAELAPSRAEHPEIIELAERIQESQSAENEQMRSWYLEWFDSEVPDAEGGGMMGPMMGSDTDLDLLRDAEDFDKEFIEQMVPHHQMAIMMSQMAGRSTDRKEMQELTDSIVETQSREIQDMQRWYREWYGE